MGKHIGSTIQQFGYRITKQFPPKVFRYGLQQEDLSKEVSHSLNLLTKREQGILRMAFGIGCPQKSLDEIGNYYELTRERVRQIKERAIRRLRGSRSVNLIPFISQ